MKIIFFGDSLTEGSLGVGYIDKVAAVLRGHHFINQGVNGDTSLNLYRRIQADVIDERPDGVLIMIGANDAISSVDSAAHTYYRFRKRVPGGKLSPISFRENMRAILGKLNASQIKTWVALPPIEYNPVQVKALREMNNHAAEVCRELHVPVLDLMAALTPKTVPERPPHSLTTYAINLQRVLFKGDFNQMRDAGSYTYTFDGLHLTDEGAQKIADLIVPFLRANGLK